MILTALAVLVVSAEPAAPSRPVTKVESVKGKAVTVKGKLEDGSPMEDLQWAADSSNACFPATQFSKFKGNHVLFQTSIPPRSAMDITVKPDDPSLDLSIYAYSIGNDVRFPPKLPSCVSCEAEHKWDRPKKGKTQDDSRTVQLRAVGNPYQVVIGVSGPAASTAGGFTLTIDTK